MRSRELQLISVTQATGGISRDLRMTLVPRVDKPHIASAVCCRNSYGLASMPTVGDTRETLYKRRVVARQYSRRMSNRAVKFVSI